MAEQIVPPSGDWATRRSWTINALSNPSLLQIADVADDRYAGRHGGWYLSIGSGRAGSCWDISYIGRLVRAIDDRPKRPIDCSLGGKTRPRPAADAFASRYSSRNDIAAEQIHGDNSFLISAHVQDMAIGSVD